MAADESRDDKTQSFVALTSGTLVLHYKILEKIGSGGMGEVYFALDTKLNRKVALKFLLPHLSQDEAARARFTREAKAAARLDHPNIVQVFEVGEFQGRPFIAMAHIEGKSLRYVIKEGKLSINESIEFTKQICEGLHKAHESGVVHRDIKPGNIIIDKDSKARILDFGLATVSGEDKLTKTGSTLGTVGYMSPEQIEGKQVDHRSDLFSTGVILYEMLTGRRPFVGENDAAVAHSITDSTPEPIARYKSGTTGELQQIVDKALFKDPALRYQHADGMLADLKRLEPEVALPRRKGFSKYIVAAAIALTVVLAMLFQPWKLEMRSLQKEEGQNDKLAVMYFDNLADPGDSLRLGEIATNLLITDLSESDYIKVVSSQRLSDLLKLLGKKNDKRIDQELATRIAGEAGAKWMLLGNILRCDPSLVLTTQIVEVSTGNTVASKRIEGKPGEDIFPLIDEITKEVKGDLSLPSEALEELDPAIAGITTTSQEAYRLYLSAIDNYDNGRIPQMIRDLKCAMAIDSTFAMVYYWASWYASSELRKELITKAVEYSKNGSKREQLYIRSRVTYYEQDYQEFLKILNQIIEYDADDKEAHFWKGWIYLQILNDPRNALVAFLESVRIDPMYARSQNYLPYVYCDLNDQENMIIASNRLIEISDSSANSLDSKGELLAMTGSLEKAIAAYQSALRIEPNFLASLFSMGVIHLYRREYTEARQYFRKLIMHENFGYRALGRYFLAYIPFYQGMITAGMRTVDNGIAADTLEMIVPFTAEKYLLKAAALRERGEFSLAAREVQTAISIQANLYPGTEGKLRYRYIELLADQHEYELAGSETAKLGENETEKRPGLEQWYWYSRAYIEHSRTNTEEALTYAKFAAERTRFTSGDYFRIRYLLGQVYLAGGQLADATSVFEELVTRFRLHQDVCPISRVKLHYFLGQTYQASGWVNEAINQYETFLDIWKNADEGLKSVEDAKARLAGLKDTI